MAETDPSGRSQAGLDGIKNEAVSRLVLSIRPIPSGGSMVVAQFWRSSNEAEMRTGATQCVLMVNSYDQEDLRWYFEDYLQYPAEPAPEQASRVEHRMRELGEAWFREIFLANDDLRAVWSDAAPLLRSLRIEINDETPEGSALPWELLRPPGGRPLALTARVFVRTVQPGAETKISGTADRVRVLLVVARPSGTRDVPFRSTASRILPTLRANPQISIELLRPPTFEALSEQLSRAREQGCPYHAVHFDGHGVYTDPTESGQRAPRPRGYLIFEDRTSADGQLLVHGKAFGRLLAENHVQLLILNACRSAHSEALSHPRELAGKEKGLTAEAFPSLAVEVVEAGVQGVLAMRYNVYVAMAAEFVNAVYVGLASGVELAEAVSEARKQLAANPLRVVVGPPRPLLDWPVPLVFETKPVSLVLPHRIEIAEKPTTPVDADRQDYGAVPRAPQLGFVGREEVLLVLDRAFDETNIVSLYGMAGSGKSAAAAEFARWYVETSGVSEPPLWTSFLRVRTVDELTEELAKALADSGQWSFLDKSAKQDFALGLASQRSILWVWDNVDTITASDKGDVNSTTAAVRSLASFLSRLMESGVKVLLTSRRRVSEWLPGAFEVLLTPLTITERFQFVSAALEKRGIELTDIAAWSSIVQYSAGNALLLRTMVSHVVRKQLWTAEQQDQYLQEIRSGVTLANELGDDETQESRDTQTLVSSLRYGFQVDFAPIDRERLGVLAFFRESAQTDVLATMGNPDAAWCPTQLANASSEYWDGLLDRVSDMGAAVRIGPGIYALHPILTPVLSAVTLLAHDDTVAYAYAYSMGAFGEHYHLIYRGGERYVVGQAQIEEENFLAACSLCIEHRWWTALVGSLSGLRVLYESHARFDTWDQLIDDIGPLVITPESLGPVSGTEVIWRFLTEFIVQRHLRKEEYVQAESLQRARIQYDLDALMRIKQDDPDWESVPEFREMLRIRGTPDLDHIKEVVAEDLTRGLAVSLDDLGNILRDQGRPDCLEAYRNAIQLFLSIGDRPSVAVTTFQMSRSLMEIPALKDLDEAQRYAEMSLELRAEGDFRGRATSYGQLGNICMARALSLEPGEAQWAEELRRSTAWHEKALALFPDWSSQDRAPAHNQLGSAYLMLGDLESGMQHFAAAISDYEMIGKDWWAASSRLNAAAGLLRFGRFAESRLYARAALSFYEGIGDEAQEQKIRMLLKATDMLEAQWPEKQ